MKAQEIYEQICQLFEQFKKDHEAGSKAGAARARKAIGEIKKLVTDYRAASVEENK